MPRGAMVGRYLEIEIAFVMVVIWRRILRMTDDDDDGGVWTRYSSPWWVFGFKSPGLDQSCQIIVRAMMTTIYSMVTIDKTRNFQSLPASHKPMAPPITSVINTLIIVSIAFTSLTMESVPSENC